MAKVRFDNAQLGYLLLRLALGVNLLIHGCVRLGAGYGDFIEKNAQLFAATVLPDWSVTAFLSAVPFVETVIGLLLIIGLWTRLTLVCGALLMISLIFGMGLLEKWDIVGLQMIYVLFYYVLLSKTADNYWSVDVHLTRRQQWR